jgi:hypothetical protein
MCEHILKIYQFLQKELTLSIYKACYLIDTVTTSRYECKCNQRFVQDELEYLGYWITRNGIQPAQQRVTAIQTISAPTKRKELCCFIGMVNY